VTPLLAAIASAIAMEPAVAAVHRRVMHGRGWVWHRSHHRRRGRGLEANDLFPVVFAAATIAAIAVGAAIARLSVLMWIGAGVTAYGVAYIVVHDLYIHERLGRLPGAGLRYIRWVADAHGVHHRSGRGPYGFLLPRVPSASGRHPGHDPLEHTPRRSRRRQCETQPA